MKWAILPPWARISTGPLNKDRGFVEYEPKVPRGVGISGASLGEHLPGLRAQKRGRREEVSGTRNPQLFENVRNVPWLDPLLGRDRNGGPGT
jgi:hypothetical protein